MKTTSTALRPRIVELVTKFSAQGETLTTTQIQEILQVRRASINDALGNLVQQGRIQNVGSNKKAFYRIKPKQEAAKPEPVVFDRGTYQGIELQRAPGIPESRYAAFSLPSRIANKLHYPCGKVTLACEAC